MAYKMFLDDERFPLDPSYLIMRSSSEAIQMVKLNGMPVEIAFDHDLGGADTSMVFINWVIEEVLNGLLGIPEDFDFTVHSQNPIGAENIRQTMQSFLRHIKENPVTIKQQSTPRERVDEFMNGSWHENF